MAFVDPNTIHNPATGTVAPASWGDTVRDDLVWTNDPDRVKLTKSADQALTTGTRTAITWNTETWDTATMHSTVSNTSRITIATAGRYLILFNGFFEINATGYRVAELWKNGDGTTWVSGATEPTPGSATYPTLTIAAEVSCSASDYLEVICYQNSGGNLNFQGGTGAWSSWFSARYISA